MEKVGPSKVKKMKKQNKPQTAPNPPLPTVQAQAPTTAAMSTVPKLPTQLQSHLTDPPLVEHEVCPLFSSQPNTKENQAVLPRLFDPARYYSKQFIISEIHIQRGRYFYLTCPWSSKCPCCQVHMPHYEFPVISIHGACYHDSQNEARAASCVFFGYENPMNLALPVEESKRQTGQVAELGACVYALMKVDKFLQKWKRERTKGDLPSRLHTVIIKSDSSYIVNGITEWVQKWKSNGWKNCKGQPVANVDTWKLVDQLVELLEKNIRVKFWLVSRAENSMAGTAGRRAVLYAQNLDHLMDSMKVA